MYLQYNAEEECFGIRDQSGWEVPCIPYGTEITVRVEGEWYRTEIKRTLSSTHSHGWYLTGLVLLALEGLTASPIYTAEAVRYV